MRKYLNILLLLTAVIYSGCTQPIQFRNLAANLPGFYMYGDKPGRNFLINEKIGDTLNTVWENETSGSQYSVSVAVYDNIVFVTDLSGKLFAFEKETGKLFGFEKFAGAITATPVVSSLRVFLMVNNKEESYSTLTAFDFLQGKIFSEEIIPGNVTNELIKLEDAIVVVSDDGVVYKYNLSGFKVWEKQTGVISKSIPAADKENIYLLNQKGEIISLSQKNGDINYRVKVSNGFESGITVDGNTAFAGDNSGDLFCFDLKAGNIRWKFSTGIKIKSIPAYDENAVYIGNLDGSVFCIDKFNGKEIWKLRSGGLINAAPLVFSDYLVQPNINKHLDFIDKKNGSLVKSMKFDTRVKMTPVYFDGLLFVGSDRGKITAFKKAGSDIN